MKKAKKNKLKVLVISGTHGNESGAVIDTNIAKVVLRSTESDESLLDLSFEEAWNEPGLYYDQREYVELKPDEDETDLNRSFPTKTHPDKAELLQRFHNKANAADVVIDVHNSPNCKNCIVINNDLYAKSYVNFATKYNIPFILTSSSTPTIKKWAIENQKVGFTVELGDMYLAEESEKEDWSGSNFICYLIRSLESEFSEDPLNFKAMTVPRTLCIPQIFEKISLETHRDGLIFSWEGLRLKGKSILRHYKKGEVICKIKDLELGSILEVIAAPCDGTLMASQTSNWATDPGVFGDFQPDYLPEQQNSN